MASFIFMILRISVIRTIKLSIFIRKVSTLLSIPASTDSLQAVVKKGTSLCGIPSH
jgi:hypothetical protein